MEKRLNKKIDTYISQFKEDIKEKVMQLGINDKEEMRQFVQFIYEYDQLALNKEDFLKRKRVKNVVNLFDRCCAKRANGEQCTRRKKEEDEYCGTHMKGTPHGIVANQEEPLVTNQKIEVWAQDIQGIIYYIDKSNNVYQAEDIVANKLNPKIIAKYTKHGESYTINI
uniref:Uncharacterized protein n=1 Tax=viral metagenome TaxID=1070528 RepID=A0A6C0E3L4_9ZZZZ